jgi:hypothetical protein
MEEVVEEAFQVILAIIQLLQMVEVPLLYHLL